MDQHQRVGRDGSDVLDLLASPNGRIALDSSARSGRLDWTGLLLFSASMYACPQVLSARRAELSIPNPNLAGNRTSAVGSLYARPSFENPAIECQGLDRHPLCSKTS